MSVIEPLELLHKASQKLVLTATLPEGKNFEDIEDFCIVFKSDLNLADEDAELRKTIAEDGGIVKDNENQKLVVSIEVADFESGPFSGVEYQIGYATKFTGSPEWFKNPTEYEGTAVFKLSRINK